VFDVHSIAGVDFTPVFKDCHTDIFIPFLFLLVSTVVVESVMHVILMVLWSGVQRTALVLQRYRLRSKPSLVILK
jgi:hypothetical protein